MYAIRSYYDSGDGISYVFPAGSLKDVRYITTDMLADGNHMIKYMIRLQEGEDGPAFGFGFGVLNQCSLRVRLPLSLVDQNRWGIDREGAFLNRITSYNVCYTKLLRWK